MYDEKKKKKQREQFLCPFYVKEVDQKNRHDKIKDISWKER